MKIKMKEKPWVLVLFAIICSVGIFVVVENDRRERLLEEELFLGPDPEYFDGDRPDLSELDGYDRFLDAMTPEQKELFRKLQTTDPERASKLLQLWVSQNPPAGPSEQPEPTPTS